MSERAKTPWQVEIFRHSIKRREQVQLIVQHVEASTPPHSRVLELGCGNGLVSHLLASAGHATVSMDIDADQVRDAARLLPGRLVLRGDGTRLPFHAGTFDAVVCSEVIEHIHARTDLLREIRRVLRPGGTLVLTTPGLDARPDINGLKCRIGLTPERYGHVIPGYHAEELRAEAESVGYDVRLLTTYSRVVTEAIEAALNVVQLRLKAGRSDVGGIGGSEETTRSKAYRAYRLVAPLLWLLSRIDDALPRHVVGHQLLMVASSAEGGVGDGREAPEARVLHEATVVSSYAHVERPRLDRRREDDGPAH